MQMTRQGIPCNVPARYSPRLKVQVMKKNYFIGKPVQIVELTRYVDGLEESTHVPINTKEHKQALKDGFRFVRTFARKTNKRGAVV